MTDRSSALLRAPVSRPVYIAAYYATDGGVSPLSRLRLFCAIRESFPRLLRAIKKPKLERAAGNEGTLMSIAVLPEKQGQGIGQALVQAFLAEAIRRDLSKVNLTTDKVDNDAVNLFYQRLGFVCARHFTTPEGRPMNEYEIALPPKGEQ